MQPLKWGEQLYESILETFPLFSTVVRLRVAIIFYSYRVVEHGTTEPNRAEDMSRTASGRKRCGGHYPKMHLFRCHLFSQTYFRLGGQTISCYWDRRHLEALPTEPPRPHRNYTNRRLSTVNIIFGAATKRQCAIYNRAGRCADRKQLCHALLIHRLSVGETVRRLPQTKELLYISASLMVHSLNSLSGGRLEGDSSLNVRWMRL